MTITMRPPKYRPSLSAQEISDCIYALELSLPTSAALPTLRIFQMKQSLGMVVPTNSSTATSQAATHIKEQPTAEDLAALNAEMLEFAAKVSINAANTSNQEAFLDHHIDQPRSAHNLEDII